SWSYSGSDSRATAPTPAPTRSTSQTPEELEPRTIEPSNPPNLKDRRCGRSEVAAENRHRVDAEPAIEHPRIHGSEVGLVMDVAGAVLERRVPRRERRGSAVKTAAHHAAEHHHQTRGAVVGAAAAVLRDAAAELR